MTFFDKFICHNNIGDNMKKNLILIIFSIITGVILSKLMFSQYDDVGGLKLVNNNATTYYFVQLGAYSSYDSMMNNTNKLYEFIYNEEDNLFYVFGCITKDENNTSKIQDYYKNIGYDSYIKEFNIANDYLEQEITNIDMLLANTEENNSIKELCKQSILVYKEG